MMSGLGITHCIDVEALPDPLLLVRRSDTCVMETNRAARAMVGLESEDLIGRPIWSLLDEPVEELREFLALCAGSMQPMLGALKLRGASRPRRVFGAAVAGAGEPMVALEFDAERRSRSDFIELTSKIDALNAEVGRRRAMEAALTEALEHARESDRLKEEFLRILSHEVRTPLNGVLGGVAVLLHRIDDPRLALIASEVRNSADALLALFGAMLDLARARAGGLEPQLEATEICGVVRDAASVVAQSARDKGVALEVVTPPTALTMPTDPRLLRQILLNLLANALKFTPAGRVSLRLEPIGPPRAVRIEVEDDGPGVPDAIAAKIFEPFFQGSTGETRSSRGVGLGLAIASAFAEQLGGALLLAPRRRRGAVFELTLPAPP